MVDNTYIEIGARDAMGAKIPLEAGAFTSTTSNPKRRRKAMHELLDKMLDRLERREKLKPLLPEGCKCTEWPIVNLACKEHSPFAKENE